MTNFTNLAIAVVLSMLTAGMTFADPDHSQEDDSENSTTASPIREGQNDMMQGMKRMRGGMMGNMGMMGAGGMPGMNMMDMDLMHMMMGKKMMGMPSAEKLRGTLQTRFEEFDADSNNMLSIEEFETLHNAMVREMMVDRFQHLDADGDGQITSDEMGALSKRLEMCPMMSGMGGMMNSGQDSEQNN